MKTLPFARSSLHRAGVCGLAGRLQAFPAAALLPLLLFLLLPARMSAQDYDYDDNGDGTCAIIGYNGRGKDVVLPGSIAGLTVTSFGIEIFDSCLSLSPPAANTNSDASIEKKALKNCGFLTSATVGNGVAQGGAFYGCLNLATMMIPFGITSIWNIAFGLSTGLTSVTIPAGVANIGEQPSDACLDLTSVTIPGSVTNIGCKAFFKCPDLAYIYFKGNAPVLADAAFFNAGHATIYYLPGATGWGRTFGGCPTAVWAPIAQTNALRATEAPLFRK